MDLVSDFLSRFPQTTIHRTQSGAPIPPRHWGIGPKGFVGPCKYPEEVSNLIQIDWKIELREVDADDEYFLRKEDSIRAEWQEPECVDYSNEHYLWKIDQNGEEIFRFEGPDGLIKDDHGRIEECMDELDAKSLFARLIYQYKLGSSGFQR